MPDPGAAIALDALSSQGGAPGAAVERRLADFMAEVKATSIASGASSQLANPAALSGELFRSLRGYLKETGRVQEMFNRKDVRMDTNDSEVAGDPGAVQLANLHSGPARAPLTANSGSTGEIGPSAKTVASIEDMKKLADRYAEIMNFGAMTSVVTGTASIVGHAVTSLTKGQ